MPIGIAIIAMMVRYRSFRAPQWPIRGLRRAVFFPNSKQDFFALFPVNSPLLPVSEKLEAGLDQSELETKWSDFIGRIGKQTGKFVVKPDEGFRDRISIFSNCSRKL